MPSSGRELLIVALSGEDGVTGYGEAAPLEPYDGVSVERVERRTGELPPGAGASRRT